MAKATTSNAAEILRSRYMKDDPERKASVQAERVNAEIARLIYAARTEAGLTQGQLAELVGTGVHKGNCAMSQYSGKRQ